MRYLREEECRKVAEDLRDKAREWEDWEKDHPESDVFARPALLADELCEVLGLEDLKGWEPILASELYSRMADLVDPALVLVPDCAPHAFEHHFYNCPHCGKVYRFNFPYQAEEEWRCESCGELFTLKVEWIPRLSTSKQPEE